MKHVRWLIIILVSVTMVNFSYKLSSQEINKTHNMNTKIATLGSGCFWCSEAIFSRLEGIENVEPGFSGGHLKNPSYKEVVTGETGHAEVAQITYNPDIISFSTLLEVFWKTHDPTTLNRQGGDVGTQYRSVIFFHDDEQESLAKEYMAALNSEKIWDNPIITEIAPFEKFYPAEDYHSDYYKNNPTNSYCNFVVTPKVEKFEKVFKDRLKE